MGISPDFFARLPMGTLSDVPVQRGVVMAASPLGNVQPDRFHDGFKAYVYRGTGVDTLTPDLYDYPAKPKPRKRKAKKRKPQPERRPRLGDRRHPEHHLYYRSHPQPLGPEPEPEPEEPDPFELLETMEAADTPDHHYRVRRPSSNQSPSPGWEPATGVDIDAWMDEYGV